MPTFAEPTWSTPEEGVFQSVFDKREITPFEVQAATVRLIQYHFSDPNQIENTLLKGLVWTPEETTSKLRVELIDSQEDIVSSKYPAIYIMREDIQATSMGELRGLKITSSAVSFAGYEKYTRHAASKLLLLCQHSSPTTTEALANEVFLRLMRMSPVITGDLRLDRYDVDGIGKPQKRKETAMYFTPVVASWHKTYDWLIFKEEPY